MTDQKPSDLGDAVDQLENDFDAFFEYLTSQPEGGADGEKTTG